MTVIPYGLRILKTDTCELCKEYGVQDCKRCHLGNPYIDCEDYDRVNDTCKSNGACQDPANKRKGAEDEG